MFCRAPTALLCEDFFLHFFFFAFCGSSGLWCAGAVVRCAVVCGGNGGLLDVGWVVRCDWGKWGLVRFLGVLGKI